MLQNFVPSAYDTESLTLKVRLECPAGRLPQEEKDHIEVVVITRWETSSM